MAMMTMTTVMWPMTQKMTTTRTQTTRTQCRTYAVSTKKSPTMISFPSMSAMSDRFDPTSKVNCPLERKRPYMSLVVLKSDYGTDREKEQKKPKKVKTQKAKFM
jgi:hypothetical protein